MGIEETIIDTQLSVINAQQWSNLLNKWPTERVDIQIDHGSLTVVYPFFKKPINGYDLDENYFDIFSAYGYGGPLSNRDALNPIESGHINNAMYLTYYESARVDLFKNCNFKEIPFIVASIKIDFLKQLHHPSKLYIGNKIDRIGKTSFDIKSAIFSNNDNSACSTAIITCVSYDYIKKIPILVPIEIKNLMSNSNLKLS